VCAAVLSVNKSHFYDCLAVSWCNVRMNTRSTGNCNNLHDGYVIFVQNTHTRARD